MGREVIMTGGQFVEDKTCSLDCYRINVESGELEDMNQSLKMARMQHSMLLVEDKQLLLVVGGEDENHNILDSCEAYSLQENQWRVLNTLNNKGKNLGLCKFYNNKGGVKQLYAYAFGSKGVERIDLSKTPIDPKWEEVKVKNIAPLNLSTMSFQFDENLILICGGQDETSSSASQDIVFYNVTYANMTKSPSIQLRLCDKFLGGLLS
jgi:Kelch motif